VSIEFCLDKIQTVKVLLCVNGHRRTGQFFLGGAEPSLPENFFDSARKNCYANLHGLISLPLFDVSLVNFMQGFIQAPFWGKLPLPKL